MTQTSFEIFSYKRITTSVIYFKAFPIYTQKKAIKKHFRNIELQFFFVSLFCFVCCCAENEGVQKY